MKLLLWRFDYILNNRIIPVFTSHGDLCRGSQKK